MALTCSDFKLLREQEVGKKLHGVKLIVYC